MSVRMIPGRISKTVMPLRRKPLSVKRDAHAQPGLRDAILAPVHGCRVGRDRSDEDDSAAALLHHPARGRLRQEVGTFQVRSDQLIEAFFCCLEDVAALAGRHARVVYKQIEASALFACEGDQRIAIVSRSDIALKRDGSRFGLQRFRRILAATIGGNYGMSCARDRSRYRVRCLCWRR